MGAVVATTNKGERLFSKNAEIFVKETIRVATDSRVQIQFTDGGLLNLISGSGFRVNTYKYKKAFQKDRSSSELVKGGFRALSGSIAKKNPKEYEVKTPSATIGLRGTILEAIIQGTTELFVGVEHGRALVSNDAGSVMIGTGEKPNYVRVPANNVPAELTVKKPLELERRLFSPPPPGGLSIDQAQTQQIPTTAPASGSAPSPDRRPDVPSIQEAPDDEGFDFQPGSGGASIQGGC